MHMAVRKHARKDSGLQFPQNLEEGRQDANKVQEQEPAKIFFQTF
jgi:hypothetical protein